MKVRDLIAALKAHPQQDKDLYLGLLEGGAVYVGGTGDGYNTATEIRDTDTMTPAELIPQLEAHPDQDAICYVRGRHSALYPLHIGENDELLHLISVPDVKP